MNIFVFGSGAWGTALSMLLVDNGHSVTLWSHDPEKAAAMAERRKNPAMPGARLPEALAITSDPAGAEKAELVLFASPSNVLRATARTASPHIRPWTVLVSATKGIEAGTEYCMSQVIREEVGKDCPVAVLSGPSHAEEVSRRMATGCVAACEDQTVAELVQRVFMNDMFRVYVNLDVVGVELCGAVKNVIALGVGIMDGLGLGDNAKALFMTRAMAEIAVLCQRAGGDRTTCSGLAGMGDLIVTCLSGHSRNRQAGLLIGRGAPVAIALREVGAVVEGYYAAASVTTLAQRLHTEMPICKSIYGILYDDMEPEDVFRGLMNRDRRGEFDYNWDRPRKA